MQARGAPRSNGAGGGRSHRLDAAAAAAQKFSLMREAKRPAELRRGYVVQPFWGLGLGFVILGCVRAGAWRRRCSWQIPTPQSESPAACGRSAIADFAAYGFAAQSLLTPGTARTPRLADVRAAARWGGHHRRCGAYAVEWAPWPAVGAWQLVGNVFFAHFWLGEPVMRTDLIGMGRARAHSQAPPAHRARLLDSSALCPRTRE